MNHTVTRKMPSLKLSARTEKKIKNSANKSLRGYTNSPRSREKEQSFHWHLKREVNSRKAEDRYNNILLNTL